MFLFAETSSSEIFQKPWPNFEPRDLGDIQYNKSVALNLPGAMVVKHSVMHALNHIQYMHVSYFSHMTVLCANSIRRKVICQTFP